MSISPTIEVVIRCPEDQKEILSARLDQQGFYAIIENDDGLSGYIYEEDFSESDILHLAESTEIEVSWSVVEEKNWNEEWEKNFEPVEIDDLVFIRAPFHAPRSHDFKYELVVEPRMSFGTGHHATTFLMARSQVKSIEFKDRSVLDCGCGTGILSILAEKLGASKVIAIDIDNWSVENAADNITLNECRRIEVKKGTIKTAGIDDKFNVILANINKNVLLEEMVGYSQLLQPGGTLLLSGFFKEDIPDLEKAAGNIGFKKQNEDTKGNWACLNYKKPIIV